MPVEQTTRSDSVPQGTVRTIEQAVADCYAGYRGDAVKRGRNPSFPYVPIYRWPSDRFGTQTTQIKGRAYAERADAVACADRHIDGMKQHMRELLMKSGCRALRSQWGVEKPHV